MILATPFHPRTAPANRTGLWSHWAGYLAAEKYQMSEKAEYFAIRNAVALFDTSPLYKYRVTGVGAEAYLGGILTRDVRRCRPGSAQYTVWCDDAGHVIEDGVVLRLAEDDFFLTCARPNLAYFAALLATDRVSVSDVSRDWAALAVQGPRSRSVLEGLWPQLSALPYMGVAEMELASRPVIVSRTGFTGDLGYELWVGSDHALDLWDAVAETAEGHGGVPVGQQAVLAARIEAGLLLIDVDYHSARFAWTANERSTPPELGLGWMLGDMEDDRPFVGREALRAERERGTARWAFTGLTVDWREWDSRHDAAGLIPPKDHRPHHAGLMVYGPGSELAGWASSFVYSPLLQHHIALARVRPDLSAPGTNVGMEVTIDHTHHTIPAEVTALPFYRPAHKTA